MCLQHLSYYTLGNGRCPCGFPEIKAWSLGMLPGLSYGGMTLMLSRGKVATVADLGCIGVWDRLILLDFGIQGLYSLDSLVETAG